METTVESPTPQAPAKDTKLSVSVPPLRFGQSMLEIQDLMVIPDGERQFNPSLLNALDLTDEELALVQGVAFDENGFLHIKRDNNNPDSHDMVFQIIKGGGGLRQQVTSNRTGQTALEVEVYEQVETDPDDSARPPSDVRITTTTVYPHMISQLSNVDSRIHEIVKRAEGFIIRGIPSFKQYWELSDLKKYGDMKKVAGGEYDRVDLGGYNARTIVIERRTKDGSYDGQTVSASTNHLLERDTKTITEKVSRQQVKLDSLNNIVPADTIDNSLTRTLKR